MTVSAKMVLVRARNEIAMGTFIIEILRGSVIACEVVSIGR